MRVRVVEWKINITIRDDFKQATWQRAAKIELKKRFPNEWKKQGDSGKALTLRKVD